MTTKRIFKYAIPGLEEHNFELELPVFHKVLNLGRQQSMFGVGLMMWAEVDPDSETMTRSFTWIPTGGYVPEEHDYLATFEFEIGLVFHLYRKREVLTEPNLPEIMHTST